MKINPLIVIPARAGSKGIIKKNSRPLNGKPLILYTLEIARELFSDTQICVSTDDPEIIALCEAQGLKVHFTRPPELASDDASTQDVLIHALDYYRDVLNQVYDTVILLQPTSPFRKQSHIIEAIELYKKEADMVVSVKETKANPYFTLFEQNESGLLHRAKESTFTRRQDCPKAYEFNGSVYVINPESLKSKGMLNFDHIIPYNMDKLYSADLDDELDWKWAEYLVAQDVF